MVDLTQIELATEEDKLYGIDHWANLFKATTWEELKMLANDNQFLQDASSTVFKLTQEEKIREQCEAREEYYRRQRNFYKGVQMKADERVREAEEKLKQEAEAQIREAEETKREAEETKREAEETKREAEETKREAEETKREADIQLREAKEMIANTEVLIAEQVEKQVAKQVAEATASKDAEIIRLKEELARLRANS